MCLCECESWTNFFGIWKRQGCWILSLTSSACFGFPMACYWTGMLHVKGIPRRICLTSFVGPYIGYLKRKEEKNFWGHCLSFDGMRDHWFRGPYLFSLKVILSLREMILQTWVTPPRYLDTIFPHYLKKTAIFASSQIMIMLVEFCYHLV